MVMLAPVFPWFLAFFCGGVADVTFELGNFLRGSGGRAKSLGGRLAAAVDLILVVEFWGHPRFPMSFYSLISWCCVFAGLVFSFLENSTSSD
jgi:hypothetical protein